MASFLVALVGRTMIVRQFIGWIRTAPAGGRAEATRSLARAWLISDLSDADRAAAEGAFLRLLDDPSPLVRQAIAEVGTAAAALELIANASAKLEPISYSRIVERHGHLPAIREKMLMMENLPSAIRLALVAKLSDTLTQFVVGRNWLSADRARRIASETRARSTVHVAARSHGDDMRGLVRHLRATGQLTAGLILRALLSGNLELFDHALVELSELPRSRVSALVYDRSG